LLGAAVTVKGWVRTKRDQKTFSFVEVNDGSCMKGVQVRDERRDRRGVHGKTFWRTGGKDEALGG